MESETKVHQEMHYFEEVDIDSTLVMSSSMNSLVEVPQHPSDKVEDFPWHELELYFKIVACHASNLAHLLRQRAVKLKHLHEMCEYFAWRMRCMSRLSLVIFKAIQSYSEEAKLSDKMNDVLATSATLSLRNCLERFRSFDSFCRALPHHSGMDQTMWSMVELGNSLEDLEKVSIGDEPLRHVMYIAETALINAVRCVRDAAGGHHSLLRIISSNT
jgi:hypothetical protein